MHAVTEPPIIISQGDQKMLRIMDYHPRRRVVRNLVTQDMHLRGAADSREGLGPSGTTAWQDVGRSTDENIPYTSKDIPLPGGLWIENTKYMLGEDVVTVFEVCESFDIAVQAYSHPSRVLSVFPILVSGWRILRKCSITPYSHPGGVIDATT